MENNNLKDSLFRFGDFELDPGRRELRHEGRPVELQPRVFDLLLYLVRNRERAVDKDELQDALWGNVIVTEASLARAVMKARKAIGDDATAQAWIRTVHGHGYHFVGEVTPVEAPEQAAPSQQAAPAPTRRGAWVIAALLLAATLVAFWWMLKPAVEPAAMRVAVLPLTDESGEAESSWTRLGLMSLVSSELSAAGELSIVEDGSVAGIASEQHWDGLLDSESGARLRDRLERVYGATHVLAMSLVREGPMLRLNYTLLDRDGRNERGTMVGRDRIELAQGVVQAVYGRLLGKSQMTHGAATVSSDPFNNEAFARGMDFSLAGRCAEAVPFFRLIVEQEPGLYAPRLELASCLRILGEPGEAERLLTALIEEQRALDEPSALGKALLTLGVVQNRTGRMDEADASYQAALEAARRAGDADLAARSLHNLSILAKNRGRWAEATDYLDRAAVEYQSAGREIMPGQLWSGYANLAMEQGELDRADDYLERALEAFRALGDRHNEAMMLNNTGYLRRLQGRLDEAAQYHLQSLAIREELKDRVGMASNYAMLAFVYQQHGDYAAARDAAEQGLALAREASDPLREALALTSLADAELALDQTDDARGHFADARALFLQIQDRMRSLQVDLRVARLDLDAGEIDDAERVASETVQAAREGAYSQPEVEALELLADVALARDDPAGAEDWLREALERSHAAGFTARETAVQVKLAELLMDQDRIEDATPLVGALARGEPSADALRVRARHAWLLGDAPTASELMTQARDLAGERWDPEDQAALQRYGGGS